MNVKYRECLIPFSDGSESYNVGSQVMVLPELDTANFYAVATDYCKPFMVERKFLSDTTNNYTWHSQN